MSCVAVVLMPLFVPGPAACQLADLPLATGVGGFLLARSACEMLCEAMAAAWAVGRAAPVRRLALLPQGGNSARVVSTERYSADINTAVCRIHNSTGLFCIPRALPWQASCQSHCRSV